MSVSANTLSQPEIIAGCARNERRAQELLYRQYYHSMVSLCIRYTKNQEDALEVLQNGFLKIFQNIQNFDELKSSLYTWIRTIMVRTAIDFLRKKNQQPEVIGWEEEFDPAIDSEVVQRMSTQQILQLVQRLPETAQAVFNLYVMEGYTHKEIGELLKISEGTSKWHLSEARKQLVGFLKIQQRA